MRSRSSLKLQLFGKTGRVGIKLVEVEIDVQVCGRYEKIEFKSNLYQRLDSLENENVCAILTWNNMHDTIP